jgi:uncharacterized protein YkwD
MEVDVFNRINKERVAGGLSALVMDETMRAVARGHSEDMIARGFFDHVNPDGLDPFERLDAACVDFVSAGENIAWNTFPNPAEEAVRGWMASPHHHDNIMRAQYNRTGIGVATDGNGAYYFTQDFIGTEAKSGEDPVFDYSEPLAITEQAQ